MKFSTCFFFTLFAFSSFKTLAQAPGQTVDVQHYSFNLWLNDVNDTIKGKAAIAVKGIKAASQVTFDLEKANADGKGMLVTSVTEKGKKLKFKQSAQTLTINTKIQLKSSHVYLITYSGVPSDGLIIAKNKYGDRTFFGDNWLNRAHNWLPCVDHVADKATVDFVVTAPAHYGVVANGVKVKETVTGATKVTQYSETAPISTKLMVIGVANFDIDKSGEPDGIPVLAYTYPQDKDQGFKAYSVAKDILPYFIKQVGPFAYKKLANVQSKTKFGGMENAGAIFYYENSVGAKDVEALVAHEIGHQWFGDAATEKGPAHVWLSEGFATYMAHHWHEHKYGADSLHKRLQQDKKLIFGFERTRKTPIVDTTRVTDYMDLLNPNSYQKAAWVLHMLRLKLGDEVFWTGVRKYYATYMNGNASTENFIAVMEKVSGQNLKQFFKQWLYTPLHPRLRITWNTDKTNHGPHVRVEQLQEVPYELPLQIMIGDTGYNLNVKNKVLDVQLAPPTKTGALVADPKGELLAEIEVMEK
ncbi:M1 family peptidase [Mucilaginibacter limnophilus]|uniref:Aminopeptidase N n=1 Tax=Mucilaginibacter limnophilus TaxID=1932778 RepID=A0A3S2UPM9_9SPHI|nr:M1 family metallopeptidase [Mucilaginibacter limnophilus]RVU01317.1 M1 family peptidase [Mucilaginibacter limnophilus]